jgi:hypothetical protein
VLFIGRTKQSSFEDFVLESDDDPMYEEQSSNFYFYPFFLALNTKEQKKNRKREIKRERERESG